MLTARPRPAAAPSPARRSGAGVRLLREAVEAGASDIHLKPGYAPMLRLDGRLRPGPGLPPLDPGEVRDLVGSLLKDSQRVMLEREQDLDVSLELEGLGRFRMNLYFDRAGLGAAIRLIPSAVPDPEEIGLPPQVAELAETSSGLILATGPTGSGKSTTLAALAASLLRKRPIHVVTLEDPVEYLLPPGRGMVTQREVGSHTRSFARALRHALRQDPDVLLVGEMRDPETISLALTAAETGHLVLSTLHTRGAPGAVARIVDSFPSRQQDQVRGQLADSLRAVVSQSLLRRAEGSGRIAVHEILVGTPAVANLVREGKNHLLHGTMETSKEAGMRTMEQALVQAVHEGWVTAEEALSASPRPAGLRRLLGLGDLQISHERASWS